MHNDNKKKIRLKFKGLSSYIKNNKAPFAVYIILRTLVIFAFVNAIIKGNYEHAFVCVLSLVLFLVPSFLTANFGIEFPSAMQIIVLLFIFAAEILGEIQCYYIIFPYWDTMLHTINGFLCAACGFGMVDILNSNPKIKFSVSPIFLAVVGFCFSMTIGVLWEFFEFSCDMLLHTDTQKDTIVNMISSVTLNPKGINEPVIIDHINDVYVNGENLNVHGYLDIGLIDTMNDLFVNFIGALVFSVIGFISAKNKKTMGFIRQLVPTMKHDNDDLLNETDIDTFDKP